MILTDAASLVSLLGFVTGTILYAMLLWMVLTSRPADNNLALLTGVCGFIWNVGSFIAYGLYGLGMTAPLPLLLAAAFGAMCFLPAVVVHSAVRTRDDWPRPGSVAVVRAAYFMSAMATVLHFYSALANGAAPSLFALRGLSVGFAALLLVLLRLTRGRHGWERSLWVAALAVFAVSALHLAGAHGGHGGEDSWWMALVGHHASILLVLAILYQDYRFALADLFLKRALGLMLFVGMIFGVYSLGVAPLLKEQPLGKGSLLLLLSMWAATGLAYPLLRSSAAWFVDTVVLRRSNYKNLLADAARIVNECETPEAVMDEVTRTLKQALSSNAMGWSETSRNEVTVFGRISATILIPTTEPLHYVLTIDSLSGGQRLLSDDQSMLDRLALLAGRRIDAIRSTHERCERDLREQEMRKLTAEAELRALRAQINPHFLFNALTTIGYLIQTSPDRALRTLIRLSGLLRSVLRSAGEFVTLGEELDLIDAYLDIEKARFEDRLHVRIDVPAEMRTLEVPALILQPIVENAVKHGIARSIRGGDVIICARVEDQTTLVLSVTDTGAGAPLSDFKPEPRHGIGLESVERRLQCHGGQSACLIIQSEPGHGTVVEIRIPIDRTDIGVEITGQDRLEEKPA